MQLTDLPLYNQLLLLLDLANVNYCYRRNYYNDPHKPKCNKVSSKVLFIPLTNDQEKLKEYEGDQYPRGSDHITIRRENHNQGIYVDLYKAKENDGNVFESSDVVERFGLLKNAYFKDKSIVPVIEKCYAMLSALSAVTVVLHELIAVFRSMLDATAQLSNLDELLFQKFYFNTELAETIDRMFNLYGRSNGSFSIKPGNNTILFYSKNAKQRIQISRDTQTNTAVQFSVIDMTDPAKYIQINYPIYQPDATGVEAIYQQIIDRFETDIKPYSQDEHFKELYENAKQYLINIKLNIDVEPMELF